MKNPCRYMVNILKISYWKVRYGKKLSIGMIQTFERVRIELIGKAKVRVGNYTQNREKLYIGVSNGTLTIGNHCFFNINSSVTCMEKIDIGDYCKFGNNLVIVDHDHNFRTSTPEFISKPIVIGKNVWVGANVTILRGTEIGDNCVIGAGSVVKGKIDANSIYFSKQNTIMRNVCN
ncbi:acyltransferase [Priestia megaterium]|uniref:acyltransferase n=1 Tax=Priestia megaterium TaxID=1404 RepID=UPI003BA17D7B